MERTIAQVSADTLAIEKYLTTAPRETLITYTEIQEASGVLMDVQGKTRLRSACRRLRLPWDVRPGLGIYLAGPGNCMNILRRGASRVGGAVRRVKVLHTIVTEQFLEDLSADDRLMHSHFSMALGVLEGGSVYMRKLIASPIAKAPAALPFPEIPGRRE